MFVVSIFPFFLNAFCCQIDLFAHLPTTKTKKKSARNTERVETYEWMWCFVCVAGPIKKERRRKTTTPSRWKVGKEIKKEHNRLCCAKLHVAPVRHSNLEATSEIRDFNLSIVRVLFIFVSFLLSQLHISAKRFFGFFFFFVNLKISYNWWWRWMEFDETR